MNDFTTADEIYFNPSKGITVDDLEDAVSRLDYGLPKEAPIGKEVHCLPYSFNDKRRRIKELDDLLIEEKFIIEQAIRRSSAVPNTSFDHYSVNLPTVSKAFHRVKGNQGKNFATIDQLIRRRAFFLANRGIARVVKEDDGLTWIYIDRQVLENLLTATKERIEKEHAEIEATRAANIDLIRSSRKIPTTPKTSKKVDPLAIPRNAKDERLVAVKLAKGIKGTMNRVDAAEFSKYFYRYNDRITDKIIALMDNKTGELIGSEYSTRFNDTKKAAIALKKFDYAMAQSLEDYWRASLLTLTTDPKRYDSLWDANRSMGKAWNKFMAWLTKRCDGERPEYIAAYEYTKTGLIHIHVILMMSWVAKKEEITEEWERIGHGTINDVRALKRQTVWNKKEKKNEYVWKWAKKRPYGSTAAHGGDYLKKYLKKAHLAKTDKYDDQAAIQALYWVFNKRFTSCSRRFLPPLGYFDLPQTVQNSTEDTGTAQESTNGDQTDEESGFSFFKVLNADEYEREMTEVGDYLVTMEGYDVLLKYKRNLKKERERERLDEMDQEVT